ncbi:hypothetical protein DMUE_3207 [Dictyocoela muelleri]|nr:hypothetical protein DMUE_3207 [Dictyocoela muelleri]
MLIHKFSFLFLASIIKKIHSTKITINKLNKQTNIPRTDKFEDEQIILYRLYYSLIDEISRNNYKVQSKINNLTFATDDFKNYFKNKSIRIDVDKKKIIINYNKEFFYSKFDFCFEKYEKTFKFNEPGLIAFVYGDLKIYHNKRDISDELSSRKYQIYTEDKNQIMNLNIIKNIKMVFDFINSKYVSGEGVTTELFLNKSNICKNYIERDNCLLFYNQDDNSIVPKQVNILPSQDNNFIAPNQVNNPIDPFQDNNFIAPNQVNNPILYSQVNNPIEPFQDNNSIVPNQVNILPSQVSESSHISSFTPIGCENLFLLANVTTAKINVQANQIIETNPKTAKNTTLNKPKIKMNVKSTVPKKHSLRQIVLGKNFKFPQRETKAIKSQKSISAQKFSINLNKNHLKGKFTPGLNTKNQI